MHHVTGHALSPRPNRNRKQHHIHHGEEGHTQPHQQIATLPLCGRAAQATCIKLVRLVTNSRQTRDQIIDRYCAISFHSRAAQGEVHPCIRHAVHLAQRPLNCRNTGRAMDCGQGQHDFRIFWQFCQMLGQRGHAAGGTGGRSWPFFVMEISAGHDLFSSPKRSGYGGNPCRHPRALSGANATALDPNLRVPAMRHQ